MTKENFTKLFWKQYLLLERDFLVTDEYVTIQKDNYKTFSNRYTYLFLNICSEMDSLAEEYCKVIEGKSKIKANTIVKKLSEILEADPKLKMKACRTNDMYSGIRLTPFTKFNEDLSADWWQDYNKIKHFRAEEPEVGIPNYQLANLKNVLHAMAALYLLMMSLYEKLGGDILELDNSRLFIDLL